MLFYRCKRCGNFVTFLTEKTKANVVCCGEEMVEVKANDTDAATEKHVPDVTVDGNKVHAVVGSVVHPMTEAHYIQFIILETNLGYHKKDLTPDMTPEADFVLVEGETPLRVYEYCNLHGLWKKEL